MLHSALASAGLPPGDNPQPNKVISRVFTIIKVVVIVLISVDIIVSLLVISDGQLRSFLLSIRQQDHSLQVLGRS